ncbi:dual oxidase maturation factor 1 [Lingula anatina]|uniref:Dual oxidase maturation factor 1 n=1 Tax=Lingula anatina TaxID=7574 RepID=A0A1S3K563_LINAN|nr:dual oxidase maturation factor 1 [Lingula anatina]|eukprot:XP_013417647.1 dual oxidase maturation factor 1 [Lingula anatina]
MITIAQRRTEGRPATDEWHQISSTMWFDLFRTNRGLALYSPQFTPVTGDIELHGVVSLGVLLVTVFVLAAAGISYGERTNTALKVLFGIGVITSILVCLHGTGWKEASVITRTDYRAYSKDQVKVAIGIHIGLKSVNITLVGDPVKQRGDTINYNERIFLYTGGKAESALKPTFKDFLKKGMPLPIISIAEYLALDGGGLRKGRYVRLAGYFTRIMLWAAFSLCILSILLFSFCPSRGAIVTVLTGLLQCAANGVYALLQPDSAMVISFRDADLKISNADFGWCFWLNLFTGFGLFLVGIFVLILYRLSPSKVNGFFVLSPLRRFRALDEHAHSDELRSEGGSPDGSPGIPLGVATPEVFGTALQPVRRRHQSRPQVPQVIIHCPSPSPKETQERIADNVVTRLPSTEEENTDL